MYIPHSYLGNKYFPHQDTRLSYIKILFADADRVRIGTNSFVGFENEKCGLQMPKRCTVEIDIMASRG